MVWTSPLIDSFDPDTVRLLSAALDDAWAELLATNHPATSDEVGCHDRMARAIILAAQAGIRDHKLLCQAAMSACIETPKQGIE